MARKQHRLDQRIAQQARPRRLHGRNGETYREGKSAHRLGGDDAQQTGLGQQLPAPARIGCFGASGHHGARRLFELLRVKIFDHVQAALLRWRMRLAMMSSWISVVPA
jgi:hypothetical protein